MVKKGLNYATANLWEFVLGKLTLAAFIVCSSFLIHSVMKKQSSGLHYFFMFAYLSGAFLLIGIIFPTEKPTSSILLNPSPKIHASRNYSVDNEE
jgi:hypothetical protein